MTTLNENQYSLLKALSWYTMGNVLIKSINFLTLRLFTSLLSTSDYGVFGVYQSYLGIFEMIILVGTAHTIKMVKYDQSIDYETYVSSVIYIPVMGAALSLFFVQLYFLFFDTLAGLTKGLWNTLLITAGMVSVANVICSKLILEGKYKAYILYSLINTVVNISVSLLLCYMRFFEGEGYWARVIGAMSSGIVSCIYLLVFMRVRRPCLKYIKTGIGMGVPLLVHAVATQVLVQTDKIVISQLVSYSAVGIYTAASNIAVIPNTLLNSIENSWSPWFYKALSEKKYGELRKKNSRIIGIFAAGLAAFLMVSPEGVRLLTAKEYWDAAYILMPLAIASFAELIYLMPLNLELFYKKNKAIWVYTLSVVVMNIVLDIIGIKLFGYVAGAYVTCISRLALFLLHYIRAGRIDRHHIIDLRIVVIALAGLTATDIFVLTCIDIWFVRWLAALAGMMAALILLRKKRKV